MSWINPFDWSNVWQGLTIIFLMVQTVFDAILIRRYKQRNAE